MPLLERKFYLTGIEFLLLGFFLGPATFNLLDVDTMKSLEPVIALVLGWVGLLFGFQFELRKLTRFPRHFFQATLIEAAFTFMVMIPSAFLILIFIIPDHVQNLWPVILMMAAAAACSSTTGISLLLRDMEKRRHDMVQLLQFVSGLDSGIAMTILSFAYIFRHPVVGESATASTFAMELLMILSACFCLLLLYNFILAQRLNENELAISIIGMVILTSGTASIYHFSPLVINFFFGFFLVNMSREKEKIFNLLASIEKPLYLILCVLLGAGWYMDAPNIIVASVAVFLCRMSAKFTGGIVMTRLFHDLRNQPKTIGFGMLDQGGLSLAIIFDFQYEFAQGMFSPIISVMLLAIVINDLVSANFMHRLFRENPHG